MIMKTKNVNLLLKSRKILFIIIIAIGIITANRMINPDNGMVRVRLQGYWNMVPDSFVINRSTEIGFSGINFNFSNKNVELPLLQTPNVDLKGKTLLDADIDEDSLKKDWYYYQKAVKESNGTWELYSSNDSIKIKAPEHPFNGRYKLVFFKTYSYGQERYFMRMYNDSTYIVCEKFFSGYVNHIILKEWNN
mgnify:CR=1 FL=1